MLSLSYAEIPEVNHTLIDHTDTLPQASDANVYKGLI